MKIIFVEKSANPAKYVYPYSVYGQMEQGDNIDQILASGFLSSRIAPGRFYLARSLRIDLSKFNLNSENRRILSKTEYMGLDMLDIDIKNYNYKIGKIAVDFYNQEGNTKKIFRPQTIKRLFKEQFFNKLFVYTEAGNVFGYCMTLQTDKSLHYAYPFYDLSYRERNAGMGMMLRATMEAKELGLKYVYLGTIYTKASLYKLQFEGLEYFDGNKWSTDLKLLKSKINE